MRPKSRCLTVVPGSDLNVTGSGDKTARVWNAKTGRKLFDLIGHADFISCITSVQGADLVVAGSTHKTGKVWNAKSGEKLFDFTDHADFFNCITSVQGTDLVVTGSDDNTGKVWKSKTGENLLNLTGHEGRELAAACCFPLISAAATKCGSSCCHSGCVVLHFRFHVRKLAALLCPCKLSCNKVWLCMLWFWLCCVIFRSQVWKLAARLSFHASDARGCQCIV